MIIKLSEYLRYSLSNEEQQLTTLETELSNIKLYLEIEKIRFGERLDFQFNCKREVLDAKIPAMILQPLFENAIKHGVYESTETINIIFEGKLEGGNLQVSLQNDFDKDARKIKGEGIGLKNVQQRLFLIFKKNDLLKITQLENSFKISINIPQND